MHIIGDVYNGNPNSLSDADLQNYKNAHPNILFFHGYKENLVDFYRNSDWLVFLSRHEGFPVSVMEANACGLPAITFDVRGCRDAIEEGQNGFLVELGNIETVVRIIDKVNSESLKAGARTHAVNNFDYKEKVNTILDNVEKYL